MAELIAGYRLRVVSPPHLTPTRLTGTRIRDGVRVSAVIYPLADDLGHDDLAPDDLAHAQPAHEELARHDLARNDLAFEAVADQSGMAGRALADARRALAVLDELSPAGVLVPDEAVAVDGGVALIYVEPPRHTLAELLERGPLTAEEIVGVLVGVLGPLSRLAEAGLAHPGVRADGLWLTAEGEVVLGDAGLAGPAVTERAAVEAMLALAESLLSDVAPSTTTVARLGLDAADSGRREVVEEVTSLRAAHAAGVLGGIVDLRARLLDHAVPETLAIPADWQRTGEDLASLLRARAVVDGPDQQPSRWSGARFRFTVPRRSSDAASPASLALPPDGGPSASGGSPGDGEESTSESGEARTVDYGPEWDDLASEPRLHIPSLRRRQSERVRAGRPHPGRSVPNPLPPRRTSAGRGGQLAVRRGGGRPSRESRGLGAQALGRGRIAAHPTSFGERIVHGWQSLAAAPLRYLPMLLIALLVSTLGTVGVVKLVDGGEHAATASGVVTRSLDASASSTAPTSGPREVEARPETPGSPASASGRSESPAPRPRATQPVRDLSGPLTDPVGLVQTLSNLRARAWRELDPARVAEVDQAESAIYRADLAAIQQARRDRLRYRGVAFTVRSATARSVGKPGHERVVLDAVVDSSAFTITPETGSPTRVAASAGDRVRMVLVWSGQHWQVAEITTPDAAG
ncbi:hypothetical protein [Nostocoides veronense]|uniref:Uncharacterized protein n=1 Tax=Nostocoides veronense TaxID=330836 RepID=A0ABN2LBK9_9MICO